MADRGPAWLFVCLFCFFAADHLCCWWMDYQWISGSLCDRLVSLFTPGTRRDWVLDAAEAAAMRAGGERERERELQVNGYWYYTGSGLLLRMDTERSINHSETNWRTQWQCCGYDNTRFISRNNQSVNLLCSTLVSQRRRTKLELGP